MINRKMYEILAAMIGAHLDYQLPWRYDLSEELPTAEAAVYVGLSRSGAVEYVGSVHRPGSPHALNARLAEHYATERWASVVVFPIKPDTPGGTVRVLEGAVGEVVWPRQNRRLPKSGLPRRTSPRDGRF
jgi:hypothetical protein